MIRKDDILLATEFGKAVILHYYPQSSVGFSSKRNFRLRSDDKNPSATVFLKDGQWFLQDKGGTDNKAYNAISLVMERESLKFPQALEWIASKFASHLIEGRVVSAAPKPTITRSDVSSSSITVNVRKEGGFTDRELSILGYRITEEICKEFSLSPVDSYITADSGKGSYIIASTPEYPIYYYDYGTFGKIYQPLGDIRFMYVGNKPESFLFANNKLLAKLRDAGKVNASADYQDDYSSEDNKLQDVIICSGPSDALNTYAAGYHVCWPNSESEDLSTYTISQLYKVAKNVYVMYDIDDTGLKNMYALALRFLDLRIIKLPAALRKIKSRGGKPCKDAKDFMVYYREPGQSNPHKLFADIVTTSLALKFWIVTETKNGYAYDLDNMPLYNFLAANGFYKIASLSDPKGYKFCKVDKNVIEIIPHEAMSSRCVEFLISYLRTNTYYYNAALIRHITRSKQINLGSLDKLCYIEPNFCAYSKDSEHIFFQNVVARITPAGIDEIPLQNSDLYVYDQSIIKHDYKVEKPFFDLRYSKKAQELLNFMDKERRSSPNSPEFLAYKKEFDTMTDLDKYEVEILRDECTFVKYVYNTGRLYWKKEELGYPLTEEERKEVQLNFINKIMALGYLLTKYKDSSKSWSVYCMEMEEAEEGKHNGGTGKSLFAKSVSLVRNQVFVNGQDFDPKDTKFLLQEVKKDITDNVFMDDLNEYVNLHRFMPMITGSMTVNPKYVPAFTIDFRESPKVVFTSNHAIRNFDSSLRRRTFFAAFSDYYHADDPVRNLVERTPASEFGKQLIWDYTPEEMNAFYNFMLQCMQAYMRFQKRINPPMKQIERRNMQRVIGDDFIWWAEEYFTGDRLNSEQDKHETFEVYKSTLSQVAANCVKLNTFMQKLKDLCYYKGWDYTPDRVLTTESEKKRREIHKRINGVDKYYFYISTNEVTTVPVDPDVPPFEIDLDF